MPGPPPPPPPMMAPVAKFVPKASGGGGDPRNALLGQIQKGTQLKKVKTVDKSSPLIAGKVAGDPTPAPSRSRGQAPTKTSPDSATSSPMRKPPGGFANITDELQFKLTLKKNKTSPTKETSVVSEQKEVSGSCDQRIVIKIIHCDGPHLIVDFNFNSIFRRHHQHHLTRSLMRLNRNKGKKRSLLEISALCSLAFIYVVSLRLVSLAPIKPHHHQAYLM